MVNRFTRRTPGPGITAISGGYSMLASFEETGALRTLTAPNVDYPQHIARTRLGIQLRDSSRVEWLTSSVAWQHSQSYEGSTGILRTESRHRLTAIRVIQRANANGQRLEIEVLVEPAVRGIVWEGHFQVGGGLIDNAIRLEHSSGCLVAYHRRHAIAVTASPAPVRFAGGSQRPRDRTTRGSKRRGFAFVGRVWGRLHLKPNPGQPVHIVLAYGTPRQATNLLHRWRPGQVLVPISQTGASSIHDGYQRLYDRSLTVIEQLRDRSGALVAGPPIDPENDHSGGYAFCWPRDGAYIAHALDTAGRHSAARKFFQWALRVPRPDGIWAQRYYADGTPAPIWSEHQLDETGTMLWALDHHLRIRGDSELEKAGLSAATDAFQTIKSLASIQGWPPATHNLWEDHFGQHAYSLASLLAAAIAWEKRARKLSDARAIALLGDSKANLRRALESWPTDREGVIARATIPGRSHNNGRVDFTADISVLGLSVPFQVLEPADPRLRATVASVVQRLSNSHGRMLRYAGDRYRGGNPWPLATLWLAWHQLRSGHFEDARQAMHQVLRDQTPAGLLAEQVDARTGAARWVVPLSWAHAWYVVVSHKLQLEVPRHNLAYS